MKYYFLTESIDSEVVGKYPQSETAKTYGNLRNIDYNVPHIESLIPPELVIEPKSILTDYLGTTINPLKFLVLKDGLTTFLKSFKIDNHQIWGIKIYQENKIITDYNLFRLNYSSEEKYVDYEDSEFFVGNLKDYKWIGESIKVSSYQNFLSTKEILQNQKFIIKAKKVIFNFRKVEEDFFRIVDITSILGTGYYVSEKLKDAIEEKGFTGMEFKEVTELDKRIEVVY